MNSIALITIGDELLAGEITNDNAKIAAKLFNRRGQKLDKVITVRDNLNEIKEAIKYLRDHHSHLFVTGGLGPTADDKTRKAIAEAFRKKLEFREEAASMISEYFSRRSLIMTSNNYRQALFPEGAEVIDNPGGTAPGFKLKCENMVIFALPGVTSEMKEMLINILDENIIHKSERQINKEYTIKTAGIGEAELESKLNHLQEEENIKFRFLPRGGEVHIKISIKNKKGKKEYTKKVENIIKNISSHLGNSVFSFDENTDIEDRVNELARNHNLYIALAESCTGGLIAKRITDVPGASQFFLGGIVAYSNFMKMRHLGVSNRILKKYGAVSQNTAAAMAAGAKELTGADIAAAVTGIAGPSGGTEAKPAGLIYFSLIHGDGGKVNKRWVFNGDRSKVRWYTSQLVLNQLRLYIIEEL